MTASPVLTTVDERGVVTVTFNRPEVNNAYNGDLIAAVLEGLGRIEKSDSVRVVVLRGQGRHFQAGADLAWINAVRPQGRGEGVT